jgi:hypothetical protein
LPHCHFLGFLAPKQRLTTSDAVDSVICAELPPDPVTLPLEQQEQGRRLEMIVITNMIHGPCGKDFPNSPCMQGGKCSKNFPKSFSSRTIVDSDMNHPIYRRRSPQEGGRTIVIQRQGRSFVVDNRWIVPYSPFQLCRYNGHINTELCMSVAGVKYLTGYIHKGADRTMARYLFVMDLRWLETFVRYF